MKKRIISLVLALVLTLVFVPNAFAAAYIMVIQPTYEDADYFSEGLAAVKLNGKWGYIDTTGKVIIPFQYDWALGFEDGEALVVIGEDDAAKYYIIDRAGKVIEELTNDDYDGPYDEEEYYFSEGLCATQDGDWDYNSKFGFVDENWKTVIAPKYDEAYNFFDGLAHVKIGDKWGCIDKTGKEIVPIKYDWLYDFSEGLAIVENDDKYGFVDRTGNLVIPIEYSFALFFSEGLAGVIFSDEPTGKWGFINKTGNVIVPPSFDDVGYYGFREGLVAVRVGDYDTGKWGFAALTLAGAADWAIPELGYALDSGIILNEMIGKWSQPTNRLLAAEAIVKLIEFIKGEDIYAIAEEYGFDMSNTFTDTKNESVTFLKASGISTGVDGVKYDPNGIFTRAQMVTMLGRMANILLDVDTASFPKGSAKFTDVPSWADEFVGWAVSAEITNGVSATLFDSNGVLTNQHTGVFAFRALSYFSVG